MTAQALAPPPEPRQLSLAGLRAVSVLGCGTKGVVFHIVPEGEGGASDVAMALKAVSREAVRHKKSGGSSGGDGHQRIWFERDVLLALRHLLIPALHGILATDAVVGFAIDRCGGVDLNSLRHRQTEKMFSDSVIRYTLNQRPYATHCRRTNGQDLIRELIREHCLLLCGAGAATVRSGAVQGLHGRSRCCLRGQAHPEEDPSVDRHSEAQHWLH